MTGIDYGTSNSCICLFDGDRYSYVDLEEAGSIMPTLLYIDREFQPAYGEEARRLFIEANRARRVHLERIDLGHIELTYGDDAFEFFEYSPFNPVNTTIDARISGWDDRNMPGFLFSGSKRLLGSPYHQSIRFLGRAYRVEAIISALLSRMVAPVKQRALSSDISIGRPVQYEFGHGQTATESNQLAVERMVRAVGYAGLDSARLMYEPAGPILTHILEHGAYPRKTLCLVIDFGGGTLDLSLFRSDRQRITVLDYHGLPIGGDLINERLIRDYLFEQLALPPDAVTQLKKNGVEIETVLDGILRWSSSYLLNRPEHYETVARAIKLMPDSRQSIHKLNHIIRKNLSYQLFLSFERCKKELSDRMQSVVSLPEIGLELPLTRGQFDRSTADFRRQLRLNIGNFLKRNGLSERGVDVVLITGGTSLIPSVKNLLNDMFDSRIESIDPFMSVVRGLAAGAWLRGRGMISDDDLWSLRVTV